MKKIALVIALCTFAFDANAFNNQNADYDQCMLQAMRGARSRIGVDATRDACRRLYINNSLLLDRERNYYGCLIQNLPGTENEYAASEIIRTCQRLNTM